MDVVEKPIGDIIPYEKNPRHNDEAVKFLGGHNGCQHLQFKNDGVSVPSNQL